MATRSRSETVRPAEIADCYRYGFSDGMAGEERAFLPFGETGSAYTAGYDAALTARLMAKAPIKPRKPQQPCDVGLFSDEADQLDLCEMFQDQPEDGL